MLLIGTLAISFAPIFVRLSEVGPSATAFWRVCLALPIFWSWSRWETRSVHVGKSVRAEWLALLVAGAAFGGDLAFWHWSIRLTSVANATLLANLAAIFVVLFGWLFFGQRVSRNFLFAMVIALGGMVLLVQGKPHLGRGSGPASARLLGDVLGITTATFYAAYLLAVKRLRACLPVGTMMAWSGVVTALLLLPIAALLGERLLPVTAHGWLILGALALISHVLGQCSIAYAMAGLPAAFVSVALLLQTVAAAAAAWLLLNEPVGPWQFLGGALVLSGIVLSRRETR